MSALRLFVVLPGALLVLGLGLVIHPHNETKLFQLAALALAVPAAVAWGQETSRGWRRSAGLLLFAGGVPSFLLVTAGFLLERGQDVAGRVPLDGAARSAYQWLATATPRRALVVPRLEADSGVNFEAPVYGRRALLWGGERFARSWGYPEREMQERRELVRTLERDPSTDSRRADLRQWAGGEMAELYTWRDRGFTDSSVLRAAGWRRAWRGKAGDWWRWRP